MGRSTGATPAGWRGHHVALLTHTRSTGTRRGPPDLLIAATALRRRVIPRRPRIQLGLLERHHGRSTTTRASPCWTSPAATAEPVPAAEKPRKFTMLVAAADDERARRLTDTVVELARICVTKSMRADVVRALVAIAAEDGELQQRVAEVLRQRDSATA